MTYIEVAPIRPLNYFENDFQKALDELTGTWNRESRNVPAIDIHEDNTNLYAEAELPGWTKDEVKLTINKGVLTLEGERKENGETTRYLRRERGAGNFSRSFTIPVEIDVKKVEAAFNNGVLRVTMPKLNPKESERTIEIR